HLALVPFLLELVFLSKPFFLELHLALLMLLFQGLPLGPPLHLGLEFPLRKFRLELLPLALGGQPLFILVAGFKLVEPLLSIRFELLSAPIKEGLDLLLALSERLGVLVKLRLRREVELLLGLLGLLPESLLQLGEGGFHFRLALGVSLLEGLLAHAVFLEELVLPLLDPAVHLPGLVCDGLGPLAVLLLKIEQIPVLALYLGLVLAH